jgi:RNA polymerase sigma-70 factor (ECF subfamily)
MKMVAARLRAQVVQLVPRARAAPVPSLDDTEIIAAVRRGDAYAATALYHRAKPQVERTLVRVLGGRDRDHEDFAQIALIELVQSLGAFRGECSLDTWISRIAARTVWKQLRRRRSDRAVFDADASADDAVASSSDTGRDVAARSLSRRVRGHLEAMDPMKAWTVILHDVCGHDLREIAEITECSVAAAQTRLSRGRIELHARIERDPELAGEMLAREGRP